MLKIAKYAKTQFLAFWLVNFVHVIEILQFDRWNFLITDLERNWKETKGIKDDSVKF